MLHVLQCKPSFQMLLLSKLFVSFQIKRGCTLRRHWPSITYPTMPRYVLFFLYFFFFFVILNECRILNVSKLNRGSKQHPIPCIPPLCLFAFFLSAYRTRPGVPLSTLLDNVNLPSFALSFTDMKKTAHTKHLTRLCFQYCTFYLLFMFVFKARDVPSPC